MTKGCRYRFFLMLIALLSILGIGVSYPNLAEAAHECGLFTDNFWCWRSNPYPCCAHGDNDYTDKNDGNCTWWAWYMMCRHWRWSSTNPAPRGWGNANTWLTEASGDGFPTGNEPRANSVFVWTSGSKGHVGWVFKVDGKYVYTTEMQCYRSEQYTNENGPENKDQGYRKWSRAKMISLGTRYIYEKKFGPHTATILVMDVSGSMAWQWKGGVKIESAKQAALQFIEQVANEPRLPGASHMIGVVTFSGTASLVLPLTEDYARAKQAIINLGTISATNLGDGLITGLQELDRVPTAQRFVILLSDGMTNTGMSRGQILTGPVVSARSKRVCIHTVAFGDPGDIDEDFLRKIATGSGCGSYNYAASGFQLFGTYVKIRHAMLGSNRIVDFTSETPKGSRAYVLPGQSITLGAFQLTGAARELHYTLAWSEPGRMRAKLVDPSGREVTYTYPGAKTYSGSGFSHVTVFSPKQGIWRVAAVVGTTFPRGIEYYGVTSARTGGIVIPYRVPKICIYDDICIPLPDLPTALIVIISVGALAVFLYQQLVVK